MLTIKQHVMATFVFTITSIASVGVHAESISGQGKCTYKPLVSNIANTNGYALMLSETTCVPSGGFIEGASVSNPEIANLYQGNGENSGFYTVSNGVDSAIAKWSGKVTTVIKDGNPMTSAKGQWEYVGGTGKFKDIKGKGEFNTYFTSATEYTVDWKGRKD